MEIAQNVRERQDKYRHYFVFDFGVQTYGRDHKN